MRRVFAVPGILVLLALSMAAQADPITSTFTGSGSGTLDGVPFGLSNFTITAVGNTANRQTPSSNAYVIQNCSASITIGDLGTYTFESPAFVYCVHYAGGLGLVGLASGTVDGNGFDLLSFPSSTAFGTWDMRTSIGPVDDTAVLDNWGRVDMNTSGGILRFTDRTGVPCTFTAEVVPEPSAFVALAAGLAGLVGMRRRRA